MGQKNKIKKNDCTELENKNNELDKKNKELEKEINKLKEIVSHTQAQYINLKKDFDAYIERVKNNQAQQKEEIFLDVIKGFVPIIEQLRLSVENIPKELKTNSWVNGIQMVYKNIIKFLESKGVYIEDSIGKDFDVEKHEPIAYQDVEECKKNKVLHEHTKLYYYKKDNDIKIICPAKVVIGK